jgi:hypothetical protein
MSKYNAENVEVSWEYKTHEKGCPNAQYSEEGKEVTFEEFNEVVKSEELTHDFWASLYGNTLYKDGEGKLRAKSYEDGELREYFIYPYEKREQIPCDCPSEKITFQQPVEEKFITIKGKIYE